MELTSSDFSLYILRCNAPSAPCLLYGSGQLTISAMMPSSPRTVASRLCIREGSVPSSSHQRRCNRLTSMYDCLLARNAACASAFFLRLSASSFFFAMVAGRDRWSVDAVKRASLPRCLLSEVSCSASADRIRAAGGICSPVGPRVVGIDLPTHETLTRPFFALASNYAPSLRKRPAIQRFMSGRRSRRL